MEITKLNKIAANNKLVDTFQNYCEANGIKPNSKKGLQFQQAFFIGALNMLDSIANFGSNSKTESSGILPNQYISLLRGELVQKIDNTGISPE